jgi:hypothetical protein
MNRVSLRTRTPSGVRVGTYTVSDTLVLEDFENKNKSLRALEQAIYASGLMVNPFEVTEACVSCGGLTYWYVARS